MEAPEWFAAAPFAGVVAVAALALAWLRHERRALAARARRGEDAVRSDMAALKEALLEARAEARVAAETQRAQSLEAYAGHVTALEGQLRQVLQQTGQQLDGGARNTREAIERFGVDLQSQLSAHRTVIADVQGQLGALGEAARGMHEVGQSIAGLHDILRAPKLRGNLGELLLAEILRQVLPADAFSLQHRFDDAAEGQLICDAVIRLGERLVPIDAKFPLESFHRLLGEREQAKFGTADAGEQKAHKAFADVVKKHIDSVASKYIRPQHGTYDFAMVYVPAENVYYEAVVRADAKAKTNLASYAAQQKIVLVSPSTLYAYLLTVLYGLRGLHISSQAEQLRNDLATLQQKFAAFFGALEKSERHLRLASQHHEDGMKRAHRLHDHMQRITGRASELEPATHAPDAIKADVSETMM